jgi:CheY-like chemotaxis protein
MADTTPLRVLIADDQQDVIDALRLLLADDGYEVVPARAPSEALERLEASDFDLAVLDLNYTRDTTSGQEGLDLIERIRSLDPTLPILVMTAWSSVAGAVEGDARRAATTSRSRGRRQAACGGADAGGTAARRPP